MTGHVVKKTKIEESPQIKTVGQPVSLERNGGKLLKTPCNVAHNNICFVLTGLSQQNKYSGFHRKNHQANNKMRQWPGEAFKSSVYTILVVQIRGECYL